MRNLKKILALVLALVMSLSLMAVASADDELNLGDVSDVYAESVDVLTGLKVFMGNKGEFLPKDNITRAEVAAIIYRIVTGDVTNSQNGIYADYNKFSDVTSDAWYAGYVNYCANAEYVKGVGYDANGKAMFKPQQNVTGYEALAMILRAIGYDRNNEFTGPSWQIQTAATARNRGILVNIQEGTLGTAATREAVAEILCKTILVPVADYSLAFGYRTTDANGKDNETLAYKTFKMEKIDGVVMANEYASLTASTPLPAGQTTLGERTLNVTSTLDDIGESRYVYVIPQSGSTRYDLVTSKTYDTGLNKVYDEGKKATLSAALSEVGLTANDSTLHFINYEEATTYEAKIRIEYVIRVRMSEYDAMNMYYENGTKDNSKLYRLQTDGKYVVDTTKTDANGVINFPSSRSDKWSNTIDSSGWTSAGFTYEYHKVINAFTDLSSTDWNNMLTIFSTADRYPTESGSVYEVGEVYIGTTSMNTSYVTVVDGSLVLANGVRDISDTMKWDDFVSNYLNEIENDKKISSNGLGNRLKIVDNDNNGIADYVLQTIYTVAIVNANGGLDIAGIRLHDGDGVNEVTAADKPINEGEGELATGNVVTYAKIDGKVYAKLADSESAKINTVNRASKTATTADAKEYSESAVHTHSAGLKSYVANLVGNTSYNLYFDRYGNLAAFTEGTNGGLVLITNGWYNNTIAGGEYAVQAYLDGSLQTVKVTTNGSLFVNPADSNNTWGKLRRDFGAVDTNGNGSINSENKGRTDNKPIRTIVANLDGEILTPVDKTYLYSQNLRMLDMKDNVIPGRDNSTTSWATPYETIYGGNNPAYNSKDIDDRNAPVNALHTAEQYEVRALSNTTYYVVYKGVGTDPVTRGDNVIVRSFTGYNSVPNIDRSYIEDVYAVGAKAGATTQNGGVTYYTAQVVVIELNDKYAGSMSHSEQVFIPDFAQVTNSIGIEDVTMIRENGEYVTVQVDMTNSKTWDYYDPAGGMGTRDRLPGLYYMDPSDSNAEVYVIQRMSPADIRANNYMAGFVRESYNTLTNNYAQVEMMVRPATVDQAKYIDDFGSITNVARAQDTMPVVPDAADMQLWQSKAVTEASKTYTLTYSSKVATLKADTAANVLTQARADGGSTIVSGLNERWDTTTGLVTNFPYASRNEILVRYDNLGNVIWAVSFDEGTGTSINFAQTVWYNCLPVAKASTDKTAFWGKTDGDLDNKITVSYGEAMAAWGNRMPIIDLGADAATVKDHTLYLKDGAFWKPLSPSEVDDEKPDPAGKNYQLVITLNTGVKVTYDLVQSANTNTAGVLKEVAGQNNVIVVITGGTKEAGTAELFIKNPETLTLSGLESLLTTVDNDGDTIKVEAWDSKGVKLENNDTTVNQAAQIKITVTSPDLDQRVYNLTQADINKAGTNYFVLTLPADGSVAAYTDAAYTTPMTDLRVTSATTVYLKANKAGTLAAVESADGTTTVTFTDSSADVDTGVALATLNLDKDITVTFTPDTSVQAKDGSITALKLNNPRALAYGAKITSVDYAVTDTTGEMSITVPNAKYLPNTGDDGNVGNQILPHWFGVQLDGDKVGYGNGFIGDGALDAKMISKSATSEVWEIVAKGYNGGKDYTMTVTFNVDQTTPVYIAHFWVASDKGNVQIVLEDLTAQKKLSVADISRVITDPSQVSITVGGQPYTNPAYVDTFTCASSGSNANCGNSDLDGAGAYKIRFGQSNGDVFTAGMRAVYSPISGGRVDGNTTFDIQIDGLKIAGIWGTLEVPTPTPTP